MKRATKFVDPPPPKRAKKSDVRKPSTSKNVNQDMDVDEKIGRKSPPKIYFSDDDEPNVFWKYDHSTPQSHHQLPIVKNTTMKPRNIKARQPVCHDVDVEVDVNVNVEVDVDESSRESRSSVELDESTQSKQSLGLSQLKGLFCYLESDRVVTEGRKIKPPQQQNTKNGRSR